MKKNVGNLQKNRLRRWSGWRQIKTINIKHNPRGISNTKVVIVIGNICKCN